MSTCLFLSLQQAISARSRTEELSCVARKQAQWTNYVRSHVEFKIQSKISLLANTIWSNLLLKPLVTDSVLLDRVIDDSLLFAHFFPFQVPNFSKYFPHWTLLNFDFQFEHLPGQWGFVLYCPLLIIWKAALVAKHTLYWIERGFFNNKINYHN